MPADPFQVLRILDYRGVQVRLTGDRLTGRMVDGGAMPADIVQFIRHFKPLIIDHLGQARAAPSQPARPGSTADPATLAARLDAGWAMCEQETDPSRRAQLEDYWCALLAEYEAACDAAQKEVA